MASVTVSRAADRLIAIKQVPGAQARDIDREAGILKQLDHPGVVRFVDVADTPGRGRALHTEFVSSDTWATRQFTDPAGRAAGVAALAEVVADLHDLGIAHCRINPSHVLHGDDDRPVLCGLRLAAEATPENRHADLVALAELCQDPAIEPAPLAGRLSALADAARAGRLSARELARRLHLLVNKRSAAEPVRADSHGTSQQRRTRSRRRSLMVVAALLTASAALLAAGIWSRGRLATSAPVTITNRAAPLTASPGDQARESPVPDAVRAPDFAGSPTTVRTNPENTAASTDPAPGAGATPAISPGSTSAMAGDSDHAAATAASPALMVPDILGAGIEVEPGLAGGNTDSAMNSTAGGSLLLPTSSGTGREPLDGSAGHESGAVLEHGGQLYGVGAPGDFVETGDWDCDGEPTPAIVRPSTGAVVLFDAWPAPAQSIAMPVRWEVDAPTGAEAVAHGSCHLLRVYTSAGSRLFDPMAGQ